MPPRDQRTSPWWQRTAVMFVIACVVVDLFPRYGPPYFRYTGSDPAHEVWNLGWPVGLIIYDSRSGIHLGPFLYVVVPFQAVLLSLFGVKAYQDACEVVCRSLAAKEWSGGVVPADRVAAKNPPTESEINKCAATLALFTSDVRIRDAFIQCFQNCTPADLGVFVGLLRQDLGYGESHFLPEKYPYIFGQTG